MRRSSVAGDRGFVTAEAAVVIPALVVFVAMLLWGVMAAATKVQCVDGARAGARAAARGESDSGIDAAVRSAVPRVAEITSREEGELVRVRVQARTAGPGPLTLALQAEAVALAEDAVGRSAAPGGTSGADS